MLALPRVSLVMCGVAVTERVNNNNNNIYPTRVHLCPDYFF